MSSLHHIAVFDDTWHHFSLQLCINQSEICISKFHQSLPVIYRLFWRLTKSMTSDIIWLRLELFEFGLLCASSKSITIPTLKNIAIKLHTVDDNLDQDVIMLANEQSTEKASTYKTSSKKIWYLCFGCNYLLKNHGEIILL